MKKRWLLMIPALMLILGLCACSGRVKLDYGTSALYTQADREAAVAVIRAEFDTWQGCELHSITYMGDACNSPENLAWMRRLGGKEYTQCIAFVSNFHTPRLNAGAWNPDEEYRGWTWYLARVDGGAWELLTNGFA